MPDYYKYLIFSPLPFVMSELMPYNPELVVMKNPIITSKLSFNPLQAQIFLEMVARIHPQDENFNEVEISIKDFAQKANIKSNAIYTEIDVATDSMNKWIYIEGSKSNLKKGFKKVTLLTKVDTKTKPGVMILKFHEELKPYLLEIKESFFSYHIEATRHLKNYHFIRLYWLLISWKEKKYPVFTLEYLKKALELEGQYPAYKDFKKRVLQPARAEFIKHGEIYFDFMEIRENPFSKRSPIEKLQFTLINNPNWKYKKNKNVVDYAITEPDFENKINIDLVKSIMSISKSIVEEQAKQFIRNNQEFKPEDIQSEIMNFFELKKNGKGILDPLAWLQTAIRTGFGKGKYEEQKRKIEENIRKESERKQIAEWKIEFDKRFEEVKEESINLATQDQIEQAKNIIPKTARQFVFDRNGNITSMDRFNEYLLQVIFGSDFNPEKQFVLWVAKNKQTTLEKFNNEFVIVHSLI